MTILLCAYLVGVCSAERDLQSIFILRHRLPGGTLFRDMMAACDDMMRTMMSNEPSSSEEHDLQADFMMAAIREHVRAVRAASDLAGMPRASGASARRVEPYEDDVGDDANDEPRHVDVARNAQSSRSAGGSGNKSCMIRVEAVTVEKMRGCRKFIQVGAIISAAIVGGAVTAHASSLYRCRYDQVVRKVCCCPDNASSAPALQNACCCDIRISEATVPLADRREIQSTPMLAMPWPVPALPHTVEDLSPSFPDWRTPRASGPPLFLRERALLL